MGIALRTWTKPVRRTEMSERVDNRYNLSNNIIRHTERLNQGPGEKNAVKSEAESGNSFRELLNRRIENNISFSKHAHNRAEERKIEIGEGELNKLNDACERASRKGIKDALIVMNDSAFIVNAGSKVIVTVVEKNELKGNIFTNIEGAVFL
jgi:flagellar operon protein